MRVLVSHGNPVIKNTRKFVAFAFSSEKFEDIENGGSA